MTLGSLFAGIGGMELALERAGMKCLWQVEIDRKCLETLESHWPKIERFKDVRECGRHNLAPVDLICGGFPCQDVSVAGSRGGLAGKRSGLWFEFARVIQELQPRWIVIENVPGLLSSQKGRDMGILLGQVAQLGYGWAYRVLDAQYFGVPQRRRRVFIVGCLGDRTSAAKVLFEPESVPGNTAKGRKAGTEVAYSIRANPSHSGDKEDGGVNTTLVAVADPLTAAMGTKWNGNNQAYNGFHFVINALDGAQGGPDDNMAQAGQLVAHTVTSKWAKQSGGPSGSELANTVMTQLGIRRLTPTECERLQGFPDGFTAMHADTTRYRQLGNAVAVPVVEWIGRGIINNK